MENTRGPGPIPNRWLNCPRKSADLIVNKFIAFKTPLSEKFDDQVPAECRFPPKMLFQLMKARKVLFIIYIIVCVIYCLLYLGEYWFMDRLNKY